MALETEGEPVMSEPAGPAAPAAPAPGAGAAAPMGPVLLDGLDPSSAAPLGWRITIVCAMVALLETTAVGMVGGSLSEIQSTFGLNDTMAGLIPTAAVLGSLAAALPAAHLADRGRRVTVLAGVAGLWTLVAVGSAWAPVFGVFLLARVLLGAAAQLNNPAAASLIADAHPARARAKAYGYERMANYLGLPLGIAVGAALSEALGWRTAFTVLAVPGVLAALAALSLHEPARGLGDLLDRRLRDRTDPGAAGEAEAAAPPTTAPPTTAPPADGGDEPGLRPPTLEQLRTLWAIPTMRTLLVGVPVLFSALASLFFWSTSYFEEVHGLAEKQAGGIAGGVGGTGIVIGIIIGSRLGDRHHGRRDGWRLQLAGTALVAGAAAFAGMLLLPSVAAQAAMFGLANVAIAMAIPNLTAAVADVVPAALRGMAFSAVQFLVALGGALGPPLVGATSDVLGSLRPAMGVLVVPMALSGAWVRRGGRHFDRDVDAVLAATGPPGPT